MTRDKKYQKVAQIFVLLFSVSFIAACSSGSSDDTNSGTNYAPQVELLSPANYNTYYEGQPITFTCSSHDREQGELPENDLIWESSIDGRIGAGTSVTISSLSVGRHLISITGTDNGDRASQESIIIYINAASDANVATDPNEIHTLPDNDGNGDTTDIVDHGNEGFWRLKQEEYRRPNGASYFFTFYTYDQDSRTIRQDTDYNNDNQFELSTILTFNEFGQITEIEKLRYSEGEFVASIETHSITVDENGRDIKIEVDVEKNGTIDKVYYADYDAYGRVSTFKVDNLNDGIIDVLRLFDFGDDPEATIPYQMTEKINIDGVNGYEEAYIKTYDQVDHSTTALLSIEYFISQIDYDENLDGLPEETLETRNNTYDINGNIKKSEVDTSINNFSFDGIIDYEIYYTWEFIKN